MLGNRRFENTNLANFARGSVQEVVLNSEAVSKKRRSVRSKSLDFFDRTFTVCSLFTGSPHPLGEKAVGRRMQLLTFATKGPFFSDAARACCQSGSAWNAAQLFSRSPRLG